MPGLLLEGDEAPRAAARGPGRRFELGAPVPSKRAIAGPSATVCLPESYGSGKLVLTARDPHWLYAHWDFTREQLRNHNASSKSGHLVLRIYERHLDSGAFVEIKLHPESRNWFVHVKRAGTAYVGQLGYYDRENAWLSLATSGPTYAPPDQASEDRGIQFENIPVDMDFKKLLKVVEDVVSENVPLVEAIARLRDEEAGPELPPPPSGRASQWSPARERALARLVSLDENRRVWIGSLEITELVKRHLHEELFSAAAPGFSESAPSAVRSERAVGGPASGPPAPPAPTRAARGKERRFWFSVNAELIIYGATEPDAQVRLGHRNIKLRPDGTFSFRFALPDGRYELPVVAASADGKESRSAALQFSRETRYNGTVGVHAQDDSLRPPHADHAG